MELGAGQVSAAPWPLYGEPAERSVAGVVMLELKRQMGDDAEE